MEVVDYLNKYGDEVVWEYMKEHPELEERLGDPLEILKGDNEETDKRSKKEDKSKKEGCAAKISRYLAFLSVEEQDEIFREITEAYKVKMQLLDDAGENDLEITTMPLRAETKGVKIWHKGTAPNSGNAFADNTYVEEVECDVLKKPMKRSEIDAAMKKLMGDLYAEKNGGIDWNSYIRRKNDEVAQYFTAKADEAIAKLAEQGDARIAKLREKAVRDGEKARSRGDNNLTDEQIASLAETMAAAAMENEKQKQQRRREEIAAVRNRIGALMQRLVPGVIYVVPQDLKNSTADMFTQSYGTFVGFKFNKSYTLGSSTAVFATLDGRRKVELALNDKAIDTIIQATEIARRYSQKEIGSITMENWDSKVPTQTRQKRYIITGNLLQALVDTEKGSGTKGNLISYSTIDGEIRQGILMGENFKPSDLRSSATLSSRLAQIRDGKTVISEDGDVQISKIMIGWEHRGDYELRVPKSKQRGGKYTMNDELLSLVWRNNFVTKGGGMVAYVSPENIAKVVDLLSREPFNLTVLEESKLEDTVGDGGAMFRDGEDIEAINERFNQRLNELSDNPQQKDRVLHLGRASTFLQSGGVPNAEILLEYDRLIRKSNEGYKNAHPFETKDIKNLPKAISEPIAVFANTSGNEGHVILTELKKNGKNFIVAIRATKQNRKGGVVLVVNEIVTLFPKEAKGVIGWINNGKATRIDKEKALRFIEALPTHPGTTITSAELDNATKVVKEFENPSVDGVKKSEGARMAARVQEIADGLNTPVRIVQSEEEISQLPTNRKLNNKGFYDTATGEVVIVVPNNENVADVENTVAHEIVAHKGLRKLVGDERFDSFLDDVYSNLDSKVKEIIDARVRGEIDRRAKKMAEQKGNGILALAEGYDEANRQREAITREMTEEYMAELAGKIGERGFEQLEKEEKSLWVKIKERVIKFLDAIMKGIHIKGFKLTDKDLAYILYRSWKNLRDNGSLFDIAEDIAMRSKTGFNEKKEYIEVVNERFNEELTKLTEENKDRIILSFGMPSAKLLSAGVENRPIKLYGNKVI